MISGTVQIIILPRLAGDREVVLIRWIIDLIVSLSLERKHSPYDHSVVPLQSRSSQTTIRHRLSHLMGTVETLFKERQFCSHAPTHLPAVVRSWQMTAARDAL